MDMLEHLVKEHREAEDLIAKLEDTEPGQRRKELVDELAHALHVHMEVEEQFLYPIVVEVIGEDEAQEGNNEHDLAREGVENLYELIDEPGWAAALDMVKAGLEHHVQDEDEDMFPELRKKAADRLNGLDPERLEEVIDLTKQQMYREAKAAGVEGRSDMTRDELARAIAERS
jgi:iron-sulfur cluster repair protein YtfE (RIC family)